MTWLGFQLLVGVLWLGAEWAVRGGGASSSRWLRIALGAAVVLMLLPRPSGALLEPLVPTMQGHPAERVARLVQTVEVAVLPVAESVAWVPWVLTAGVVGLFLLQVVGWVRRLRAAVVVRRIGQVRIALHPDGPCTVWMGRPWILVDPVTWADPSSRDLAVRHELAHLRHRDPHFAWVMAALVAVCALNPFAWLLARRMAELDELSVDQTLLRRGASPRAYGQLLLSVATRPTAPSLAAGLMPRPSFLHRRLRMLSSPRSTRRLPWAVLALSLTAVAWAGPRSTPDLSEITSVASTADLRVPDHPRVADALTRLEGSAFVERALSRRGSQGPAIRAALAKAGLPHQLEAVAFIESGFQADLSTGDLDSAAPAGGPVGAGLWMFIPSTARAYGLEVGPKLDERLDPDLETQAAIALLSDMHQVFGDWGLALAAYNQGEKHVRQAIRTHGSRDALVLAEAGALNRYVPTVYAGMAILAGQD